MVEVREVPPADERWLVIDERRLRYVIFDTRLLADRVLQPLDLVVFAAVAWHTNMRAREAELPLAELAPYAGASTRSVQRSLDRLRSIETGPEARPGYIYKVERPGQANLWGLHDHAAFPTPQARTPWSTTAPVAADLDAADQLAYPHRWVTGLDGMRHVIDFDTRLLLDTMLDEYAIAAYLGITWHIGYRGSWPSMDRLEKLTKVGQTRLRGAIATLCTAGYIARTQRQGKTTVFSVLPLERRPVPPGWSPWSTPDTAEHVPADQARDNESKARGPHTDAERAMARDWLGTAGTATHDSGEGVLSTPPDGDEPRLSTAHDTDEPDPRHRRGRSTSTPPTTPPPPSADPARPGSSGRPMSAQARRSRKARALRDAPRDPKARDTIQRAAARRALLIVENWRAQLVAGDVELEMLADRVRADCHRDRHRRAIDVDAVVATALDAAQVLIDTSRRRTNSSTNPPNTTEE